MIRNYITASLKSQLPHTRQATICRGSNTRTRDDIIKTTQVFISFHASYLLMFWKYTIRDYFEYIFISILISLYATPLITTRRAMRIISQLIILRLRSFRSPLVSYYLLSAAIIVAFELHMLEASASFHDASLMLLLFAYYRILFTPHYLLRHFNSGRGISHWQVRTGYLLLLIPVTSSQYASTRWHIFTADMLLSKSAILMLFNYMMMRHWHYFLIFDALVIDIDILLLRYDLILRPP